MKCPRCKRKIGNNDKVCKYCHAHINNRTISKNKNKNIRYKTNRWLVFTIVILTLIILIESSFGIWYIFSINDIIKNKSEKIIYIESKNDTPIKEYNMNESFIFDNLKITVKNNYSFVKLKNEYSKYNGRNVVKVPVVVKNISDKNYSLNLYYYTLYNQNGKEIDEVAAYFDESLFYAKDLKPDESYTKYLYFMYEGDGTYSITFKNKEESINVDFSIIKKIDNKQQDNNPVEEEITKRL